MNKKKYGKTILFKIKMNEKKNNNERKIQENANTILYIR